MSNFSASEIIGIIQILIGIGALSLAILAYRKVLKQIDISNQQTQLTIEQVGSLNRERQADLKTKLFAEINMQIRQFSELRKNYETMEIEISQLEIITKNKIPEVLPLAQNLSNTFQKKKQHNLNIINNELKALTDLYDEVFNMEANVGFLENTLQTVIRKNKKANEAEVEFKQVKDLMSNVNQLVIHKFLN